MTGTAIDVALTVEGVRGAADLAASVGRMGRTASFARSNEVLGAERIAAESVGDTARYESYRDNLGKVPQSLNNSSARVVSFRGNEDTQYA